jgi:hypothetical protein
MLAGDPLGAAIDAVAGHGGSVVGVAAMFKYWGDS